MEAENREIVARAERYDGLVLQAGWDDITRLMMAKINAEIATATDCPLEPERQRIHVVRWNAMRELLDFATGEITAVRKTRDEIKQVEEQDERSYGD